MAITRRVYVSMPADNVGLSRSQHALKWGIVEKIEQAGYSTEVFFDPRGVRGLAASKSWTAGEADRVARCCVGAAIIGLPRWQIPTPAGTFLAATEYNHYEGALAYTYRLPMLVLVQEDVLRRGVFDDRFGVYIGKFPTNATKSWLNSRDWQATFSNWKNLMSERRDIFLGYCGSSAATAKSIKDFLVSTLGLSILDWQTDFPPGGSILSRIEQAATKCSAGIFLFTKDDDLVGSTAAAMAAPRDNVVFEAGLFVHAKGKERVLIVLEKGAKMPADLGGDIYASLEDKTNIAPITETLRRFVEAL